MRYLHTMGLDDENIDRLWKWVSEKYGEKRGTMSFDDALKALLNEVGA